MICKECGYRDDFRIRNLQIASYNILNHSINGEWICINCYPKVKNFCECCDSELDSKKYVKMESNSILYMNKRLIDYINV